MRFNSLICWKAHQEQMEILITIKCCNKLRFVILVTFVLGFLNLGMDHSSLIGSNFLVNKYVNGTGTLKSNSLRVTVSSNDTINLFHNTQNENAPIFEVFSSKIPLVNVENKTNIVSKHRSKEQGVKMKSDLDLCLGRYIYIHNLPSRFNEDVLKNCLVLTKRNKKNNLCPYIQNFGFGPHVENSDGVLSNKSWFSTNQFLLEVIFHNKMKKYECLTNDSSLASAIFVPYYAGIDLRRYLWGFNTSMRDANAIDLVKWLAGKPEWKRMWGRDHFLVGGRISRDFRRQSDSNSAWGSKFRFLPESKNMSMLSIEASSWNNDLAIPYPTYFHPSKDGEVFQWQDKMRRQKRRYLFSFVGAPRSKSKGSIRGDIINQCLASTGLCKLMQCDFGSQNCENPVNLMKLFQSSVFCLQPPGDSFTRRSTFDSILAGCIPVFFHPGSAYSQYLWHLPKNHTKYSVFIPAKVLRRGKVKINETLHQILKKEELAMREEVIKLIPQLIYSDPRSRLETLEDAFDLAIKGILKRIETART